MSQAADFNTNTKYYC